jgi:hypothetical protein
LEEAIMKIKRARDKPTSTLTEGEGLKTWGFTLKKGELSVEFDVGEELEEEMILEMPDQKTVAALDEELQERFGADITKVDVEGEFSNDGSVRILKKGRPGRLSKLPRGRVLN